MKKNSHSKYLSLQGKQSIFDNIRDIIGKIFCFLKDHLSASCETEIGNSLLQFLIALYLQTSF